MSTMQAINGIHHITAISSSAAATVAFYENVLGLRLVKQTVNFDDPFTYHLYFGDRHGSPGTILTFFPWADVPRGTLGAGMVTAIAFEIPVGALDYWHQRLQHQRIAAQSGTRFGDDMLSCTDPDGLTLELIASARPDSTTGPRPDAASPGQGIRRLHSATALTRSADKTGALLTQSLGMIQREREHDRVRFAMNTEGSPGCFYDLVVDPQAKDGRQGSGTVHHIAFRTPSDAEQVQWKRLLRDDGYQVTAIRDRNYFKSIYFHEPGGVLFEIATDPPGFTVDEQPEHLGSALQLPEQYEARRAEIVSGLPPLHRDKN